MCSEPQILILLSAWSERIHLYELTKRIEDIDNMTSSYKCRIQLYMYDEAMSVEDQDVAIVKCIATMMNVQIHIVHSWLVS